MVREAGVEPARPEWTLEPESSESANSTTRAYAVFRLPGHNIIAAENCQQFFSDFSPSFIESKFAFSVQI